MKGRERAALLVVDMQKDFLPGGALAVAEGDRIVAGIRERMLAGGQQLCVATQDWHPPGHVSFATSHRGRQPLETIQWRGRPQTLWPEHCVQGTPGAELVDELPWAAASAIVRKGTDPAVDAYSAFRDNPDGEGRAAPTGLGGYLAERGVGEVWICGLARDVCCKGTAEDAVRAGFVVRLLWDLTRPVDPASDERVRRELEQRGVRILTRCASASGA